MKLKWKNKIQSGALQFTIFISVLIALLLAGIILLTHTHKYFIEQSKAVVQNIQLSDTGIASLIVQESLSSDTTYVNVPGSLDDQKVQTHLSHWGIFEKAYVKSIHRQKTFVKCSLLGTGLKGSDRKAVYLEDTYTPLAVVGNTRIQGNASLPGQGVRSGNILGNSYYGSDLIYGAVSTSDKEMPKLKFDYRQQLQYYLQRYEPADASSAIPVTSNNKVINSFKNPVKGHYITGPIVLEGVCIYGNIIIRSDEKITVKKSTDLRDIILSAPTIIIEDDVKGNFQAIAKTSIKVGKNCSLSYPTALILVEDEGQPLLPQIDPFNNMICIDANSIIKGSICYFNNGDTEERDYKVNVFLGQQSSLKGELYCEGNVELKASHIQGSVYTKHFVANEGGTTFVNHIYNASIISDKLPEAFGGISFEGQSKTVAKWLY